MILRRLGLVMCIFLVLSTVFVIFNVNCSKFYTTPVPVITTTLQKSNITDNSILIYQVYSRTFRNQNETILEILALNKCMPQSFSLSAQYGNRNLSLSATPIEGTCPWSWAPGCQLNAHMFTASIRGEDLLEKEILVIDSNSATTTSSPIVSWNEEQLIPGTSICVPPLYWYTDWTKLLFFLEWWKSQGISEIIIYYYSSTETVKKMLDSYVQEGLVRLVQWPLLPSNTDYDPNNSVYRLSHSLAHNDCLRKIKTEYGMLLDIDEIIVHRNSIPILPFIRRHFSSNPTLGSLSFQHASLMFNPPLTSSSSEFNFHGLDYRGIANASFSSRKGPPKVAFRTAAISRLQTHNIGEFMTDKYQTLQVPKSEAILLHNRYTNVASTTDRTEQIEIIQPEELDIFRLGLIAKKMMIYPNEASFHQGTQKALGECLAKWRTNQNNCKNPVLGCQEEMPHRENWTSVDKEKSFIQYSVVNL